MLGASGHRVATLASCESPDTPSLRSMRSCNGWDVGQGWAASLLLSAAAQISVGGWASGVALRMGIVGECNAGAAVRVLASGARMGRASSGQKLGMQSRRRIT